MPTNLADTIQSGGEFVIAQGLLKLNNYNPLPTLPDARYPAGTMALDGSRSPSVVVKVNAAATGWETVSGSPQVIEWQNGSSWTTVAAKIPAPGAGAVIILLEDVDGFSTWQITSTVNLSNVKFVGHLKTESSSAALRFSATPTGSQIDVTGVTVIADSGTPIYAGSGPFMGRFKDCALKCVSFGKSFSGPLIQTTGGSSSGILLDLDNCSTLGASSTIAPIDFSQGTGFMNIDLHLRNQTALGAYTYNANIGGMGMVFGHANITRDCTIPADDPLVFSGGLFTSGNTIVGDAVSLPYNNGAGWSSPVTNVSAALDALHALGGGTTMIKWTQSQSWSTIVSQIPSGSPCIIFLVDDGSAQPFAIGSTVVDLSLVKFVGIATSEIFASLGRPPRVELEFNGPNTTGYGSVFNFENINMNDLGTGALFFGSSNIYIIAKNCRFYSTANNLPPINCSGSHMDLTFDNVQVDGTTGFGKFFEFTGTTLTVKLTNQSTLGANSFLSSGGITFNVTADGTSSISSSAFSTSPGSTTLTLKGDPHNEAYSAVSANWSGSPTNVGDALDRMAALLKTLNGGTPIP